MLWNVAGGYGLRTGAILVFALLYTYVPATPSAASPTIPPRCASHEEIILEGAAFGAAIIDAFQTSADCESNLCLCAQSDALQILDNKISTFKESCHAWAGKPKTISTPDWSLDEGIYFYAPGYRYSSTPHCIPSSSSDDHLSAVVLASYVCCRSKNTQFPKPPYVLFDRLEISCEMLKGPGFHDAGITNPQEKIIESSRYSCNTAVDRLKSQAARIQSDFSQECAKFHGSSISEYLTPRHTICSYSGAPEHLYYARAGIDLRCCAPNTCIPAGQPFDYGSSSDMRRGCCGNAEPTTMHGRGECREPVKQLSNTSATPVKPKISPSPAPK